MAHRSRTVHATAAVFWLAVGLIALLAGALASGALVGRAEREPAPGGLRLASVEETRRVTLRLAAVALACGVERRPDRGAAPRSAHALGASPPGRADRPDDPAAPPRPSPRAVLAATGRRPSRDPADYR